MNRHLLQVLANVATAIVAVFLLAGQAAADNPTEASGWRWLFHGDQKDLEQWMPGVLPRKPVPKGSWVVREGELMVETNSGILWTKETFSNFILELEVTVSAKGHSGVFIRAKREDPVVLPKNLVRGERRQIDRRVLAPAIPARAGFWGDERKLRPE